MSLIFKNILRNVPEAEIFSEFIFACWRSVKCNETLEMKKEGINFSLIWE